MKMETLITTLPSGMKYLPSSVRVVIDFLALRCQSFDRVETQLFTRKCILHMHFWRKKSPFVGNRPPVLDVCCLSRALVKSTWRTEPLMDDHFQGLKGSRPVERHSKYCASNPDHCTVHLWQEPRLLSGLHLLDHAIRYVGI